MIAFTTTSCSGDDVADRADSIFERIGPNDPFCTAAVRIADTVVFAGAYGSSEETRVTIDTPVDIASVSKQFTGVVIELLIDRGELVGSDVVADLVPDSAPATTGLTIDQLLTHTSGLADYTELLDQDEDETSTQRDALDAIAQSEPTGREGTFNYSNSNYVLLAEVVEAVTGRPLPEFLDDEVFQPLDLDMAVDPAGPWKQVGDGSIRTTPTELVNWSAQYWDQTLVGPDLLDVMFEPEVEAVEDGEWAEDYYGSGILRRTTGDGTELVFHDGSWDGFETDWMVIPEQRAAAAVTCDANATLTSDTPAEALLSR